VSVHPAFILDASKNDPIEVELHDDLTIDALLDIEDQWTPARNELRSKLKKLEVARDQWPQSLHWDWARKSVGLAFRGASNFRVMGLRRQTFWQAAMLTVSTGYVSQLLPHAGKPLVYLEYLEVAPWNWTVDKLQVRKFKAIGPLLFRAAVEESYALGWEGRLGLHALPQASAFYQSLGARFVKNDPSKQNLPYYELSAKEAIKQTGRT